MNGEIIATLIGVSTNPLWALNLTIRETINETDTSLSAEIVVSNASVNDIVITEVGRLKFTEQFGSSSNSYDSLVQKGTTKSGASVYRSFKWLDRMPHTAYVDGYCSLPVQLTVEGTINGDVFTQTIDSVIELTPLVEPDKIIHTEITEDDKIALAEGSVAIKTKMIVQPTATDNTYLTLSEEDSIKDWSLEDERYVPNEGFIGQFVARTLSGNLQNVSDDFNIENREVQLLMGVVKLGSRYQYLQTEDGEILIDEFGNKITTKDLGDDITTWYSLGNFLITKPEDNEVSDNTSFESFDYTTKFNEVFNADYTSSSFPLSFNDRLKQGIITTTEDLARYTCEQVGVTLGNTSFTNASFRINSNQFTEGNSCRDVMKAISQLALGWCEIGWDNKCYIKRIANTSTLAADETVLTNDNYYSLTTQKEMYGPVNRISIGMSSVEGENVYVEDTNSITLNGVTEIVINDNPFLYTEELRNNFIDNAQSLMGLTYTPLETETPGHPWLKANEKITVRNMEGVGRNTYPFNRTLNYTGHIKSVLNIPSPTKQETSTGYDKNLYETLRDVGIRVNKQDGIINIINSNTQAALNGLSSIEKRFDMEITETYSKQQIQEIIKGISPDGTVVESVKTTAGTFDKDGLTIEQSNADTKTNINADGMKIYNAKSGINSEPLLDVNSEGIDAENIKVRTYLNIGSHSRIEDYTHTDYTQGTGVFWIGGGY